MNSDPERRSAWTEAIQNVADGLFSNAASNWARAAVNFALFLAMVAGLLVYALSGSCL